MSSTIDALYAGFADALPPDLSTLARDLPHALGLAPVRGVAWSAVFSHAVTLEAPRLVADAFPGAKGDVVRQAVLAHALSVIEAFGQDRIADRQVQGGAALVALLAQLRFSRDSVLESVWPGSGALAHEADLETMEAIREEHALLSRIAAVSFPDYHRISLSKQAVGFPASVALARAVGATERQVELVRRSLAGVWLGLQLEDDAMDWEDDWRRGGGAWAVSLARRRLEAVPQQRSDERPTEPDLIRRRVLSTRALYYMLRGARHQYRVAWRHARSLGAVTLARWAEQRMARLDNLLPLEEQHAGYVVRAMKLAPWAAEVLT